MERAISRRAFAKRLSVGAALVALQPACTSMRSRPTGQALRNDLTGLSGTLLIDDAIRYAASRDFGNIVHRLPSAVLRPGGAGDIVKLVQLANQQGFKVAMRTAGSHAFFGQSQVEGGVVIDARPLNAVRVVTVGGRPALDVGPGAQWGPVLDTANASRLTPPVNIDDMPLSVGGTLSTMGFGGATGREGFQVDHVLELEVVTGSGELVTCSDQRNSDLFNAVLAGMGQCAIIVKAVMELVPGPANVLFFLLSYPDLQTAVADLTRLVNGGRFQHLDGRTVPRQGGGFTYNVEAGVFYDTPTPPDEAPLLDGLKFESKTTRPMNFAAYYRRAQDFSPAAYLLPHPWLYLCLPAAGFMDYATKIIATPAEVAFANPRFSVWQRKSMKRPLARVPDGDLVYRFQLGRVPPETADIAALVAMNRTLYERARDVGGTRMTSSAIPFSPEDWVRHYGPAWPAFAAAKARYDPKNVLTPGQRMFSTEG
jgi:FAD/FMN-containing dehydrogenase